MSSKKFQFIIDAKWNGHNDLARASKDMSQLGRATKLKKLGNEWLQLKRQFNEAKNALEQQASEMKKTDNVSKQLASSYAKAQNQVKRLAAAVEKKKNAYQKAAAAADKLGIDTNNLHKEEIRLRQAVVKTNQAMANRVKLAQGLEKIKASALGLAAAGLAVTKAFHDFSAFESGMAEVYTLLDVSEERFASFKDSVRTVMAELPQGSADLAKALYDINSAGVDMDSSARALQLAAMAATAGITDTTTAVKAGLGSLNAYGKDIGDLSETYDTLFQVVKKGVTTFPELAEHIGEILPGARSAGVSLEEVGAAIAVLTKAGIKTPKAATAIKGAIRSMAAPAPEAKKIFDELGISWRGMLPTLKDIAAHNLGIDQMRKLIPDTEAATGILSLTQNLEGLEDILISMDHAAGSMEQAYEKMADTPEHKIKLLQKNITEISVSLGRLASSILLPLTDGLNRFIKGINNSNVVVQGLAASLGGVASGALLWKVGLGSAVRGVADLGVVVWDAAKGLKKMGIEGAGIKIATTAMEYFSSAVGLARAAMVKLTTFAAANPFTAGLTVAVLAAAGAYALLRDNSLQASKDHAEAAAKLAENRREMDRQVETLQHLQHVFANTASDSEEYMAAERELATILPKANLSLDRHGQLIAQVGEVSGDNRGKLAAYTAHLKEQSRLNLALELEQQANAYVEADKALKNYKKNLVEWYGIGGQGDWDAGFWRALNKLTGTYNKNIQKGKEIRQNLEEQRQGYTSLLASIKQTGVSSEDLAGALERMHMAADLKESVLNDYNNLQLSLKKVSTAADDSATKQEIRFKQAAKMIKGEYAKMAGEVKNILAEIADREQSLGEELREMGRSTMAPESAWEDLRKEAEEYYNAAEKAAGQGSFDDAVKLADKAKEKYKALNREVKSGDRLLISHQRALKTAMAGVERAGKLAIQSLQQEKESITEQAAELARQAGGFSDNWSKAWQSFLQDGKMSVAALGKEIDRLIKRRTLTINLEIKERKSSHSPQGFRHGGRINAQRLASGGRVTAYNGLSGLVLRGFGGGDRRHVLAEDGEVMIRKEAVRQAGLTAALAFNAGRWDVVLEELTRRIPSPIRRQSGGVISSGLGSSPQFAAGGIGGNPTNITMNINFTGGIGHNQREIRQQAKRLMQELEQMYRSASR